MTASFRQVRLQRGETLDAGGKRQICFPTTAILSVTNRDGLEVGLIGSEGMTGWTAALSGFDQPLPVVVEQSGTVATLDGAQLRDICAGFAALRGAVLQFAVAMTAQMAATIIATATHHSGRRLARRLLMIHDRCPVDSFAATHAQLGRSMAMRRATVTNCLHLLESDRIVRCTRNQIEVLDRRKLERAAGPAYGSAERSYRAVFAQ